MKKKTVTKILLALVILGLVVCIGVIAANVYIKSVTKDFVWCIIQPEPTFRGEKIPITANGSLTDG